MAQNTNFIEILKTILTVLLGCTLCLGVTLFVILSAPVYLFRYFVIQLANSMRPDLDEILDVTSSVLVNDFFSGKPPRANTVSSVYIQGHVTAKEVEALVLKNWINARDPVTGELPYKKFQQYPVRWLGFTFWKNDNDNFSMKNHVFTSYDNSTCVTDNEVDTILEICLNYSFPKNQSPWSFHVIENYKGEHSKGEQQSVLIFTFHHCITDGFGIRTAFVQGLLEYRSINMETSSENIVQRESLHQIIWGMTTFTIKLFKELVIFLPKQLGIPGSPWLVPDRKKKWHHICCRAKPILLRDITAVQKKFGGSITSVITSAVSAATYKMLEMDGNSHVKSMLCFTSLQNAGSTKMKTLSNEANGQTFDVPTIKMLGPAHRLRKVNQILETTKDSMVFIIMQGCAVVLGSHFYPVCEALVKNRGISIGITIVPMPITVNLNGMPVTGGDSFAGGLQGNLGVCFAARSYGNEVRIGVSAEAGLMSRDELKQFAEFFDKEICSLQELTQNANL